MLNACVRLCSFNYFAIEIDKTFQQLIGDLPVLLHSSFREDQLNFK